MVLERLELTDFRNYATLRLEPRPGLNVLVGENAQGKSNLLEAVGLLALARSERAARDGDLVRWGADEAVVRGEARRAVRGEVSVALVLQRDGAKAMRVDGQPCRRLADGVGALNVVFFGPRELELVSGGPDARRDFLNTCLGQIDPEYLAALAGYRRVLRQRNGLLRAALQRRLDEDLLLAYDDGLADHAALIMERRRDRVRELAEQAALAHARLCGGRDGLAVSYAPHLDAAGDRAALANTVRESLIARRNEELRRGLTLVGPHRDDLRLTLDGKEARGFASQGQQRSIALALKVAELRTVRAALGEPPLLLLDDVLSELDSHRRGEVLGLVAEAEQVFLTCTDPPSLVGSVTWRVHAGSVEEAGS